MDNANATAIHHQQQQQQPQQQHQQQFCLRWHNHQASLLSALPILLDQSHLTDVTLSAEGKTLRAHRVVLSACSKFFSELFRTLDSSNHPVIVITGASFGAMVALLTFMYSGEVNVFEGQIPTLLALAETLGIKGLADFQNNLQNTAGKSPKCDERSPSQKDDDTLSPPTPPAATATTKIPTPLENFFMKSLQFYPNLIPQPLNFSQSALNKTSEFLAKYQQQCNLYQAAKDKDDLTKIDEKCNKRSSSGDRKLKDIKKIDKIAENLRIVTNNQKPSCSNNDTIITNQKWSTNMMQQHQTSPTPLILKPPIFSTSNTQQPSPANLENSTGDHLSNKQYNNPSDNLSPSLTTTAPPSVIQESSILEKTISNPQPKIANSKLYATCFICHKQLSNQYNLRVHLETHQNVKYACNVCSHVSRSKDALRKHVSYRHPGAPSPCESEARRKRSKIINTPSQFKLLKPDTLDEPINQQPFMFNMSNQFHQRSQGSPLQQIPPQSQTQSQSQSQSQLQSPSTTTQSSSPTITPTPISTPTCTSSSSQRNEISEIKREIDVPQNQTEAFDSPGV